MSYDIGIRTIFVQEREYVCLHFVSCSWLEIEEAKDAMRVRKKLVSVADTYLLFIIGRKKVIWALLLNQADQLNRGCRWGGVIH